MSWTFVSCFFDLDAYQKKNTASRRALDYLEQATHVLKIPVPLVLFISPSLVETVTKLLPVGCKVHVIPLGIEETNTFKECYTTVVENRTKQHQYNDSNRNTSVYCITTVAKFECMRRAVELDPFGSEMFAWIDFHYGHNNPTFDLSNLQQQVQNITRYPLWTKHYYVGLIDWLPTSYYNNKALYYDPVGIRTTFAGGFHFGNKDVIPLVSQVILTEFKNTIAMGLGHAEEQLIYYVYRKNPALFQVFPCDYPGIIFNAILPTRDINCTLHNLLPHLLADDQYDLIRSIVAQLTISATKGFIHLPDTFYRDWYKIQFPNVEKYYSNISSCLQLGNLDHTATILGKCPNLKITRVDESNRNILLTDSFPDRYRHLKNLGIPSFEVDLIHVIDFGKEPIIPNVIRFCKAGTILIIRSPIVSKYTELVEETAGMYVYQIKEIPQKKQITIVSALYDIRSREHLPVVHNVKTHQDYIKYGQFLLSLPYNIVLYLDPKIVEDFRWVTGQNIIIKPVALEDTEYWSYHDKLIELRSKWTIPELNPLKATLLYQILVCNKLYFLECAARENPFQSSHFVWMDFGITHVAQRPETIHRWIEYVPDKIRQLCTNVIPKHTDKDYFRITRHNVMGGVISGRIDNILKYVDLFRQKWISILENSWYQLEETSMAMVMQEHPEIIDLYYSDTPSIICSYDYPIELDWCVVKAINYCHDSYDHAQAYRILQYCKSKFIKDPWFIEKYIITNWYITKELDPDIKEIVLSNPDLYAANRSNLAHYKL